MHIVLDTRIIETSTGRYMQRLLEHLHDDYTDDGHHYTALVPSVYVDKWQQRLPRFSVVAADQKWYTFSEQWSLYWQLRQLKPDLVHFTMPQQPFLWTGPAVTTIHDMTLIRFDNIDDTHPLLYKFKKAVFLALMRTVLGRAKRVIVPTNFVRDDLGRFFGKKHLDRVSITYEAGEIPDVEPETVVDLEGEPFFFFVGNAFPYKNVERIVEAFAELVKTYPELHLALAGKKDFFYEKIEADATNRAIPNVHILGFVTDGEKRWLFQNAVGFVTASKSEGFCIPLLEAMVEGAPVISSNASCLPEVAGDGAIYFDPDSTYGLVAAMKSLLNDSSARQKLKAAGTKRFAEFSWKKMTDETHAIYEDVLSKK